MAQDHRRQAARFPRRQAAALQVGAPGLGGRSVQGRKWPARGGGGGASADALDTRHPAEAGDAARQGAPSEGCTGSAWPGDSADPHSEQHRRVSDPLPWPPRCTYGLSPSTAPYRSLSAAGCCPTASAAPLLLSPLSTPPCTPSLLLTSRLQQWSPIRRPGWSNLLAKWSIGPGDLPFYWYIPLGV